MAADEPHDPARPDSPVIEVGGAILTPWGWREVVELRPREVVVNAAGLLRPSAALLARSVVKTSLSKTDWQDPLRKQQVLEAWSRAQAVKTSLAARQVGHA